MNKKERLVYFKRNVREKIYSTVLRTCCINASRMDGSVVAAAIYCCCCCFFTLLVLLNVSKSYHFISYLTHTVVQIPIQIQYLISNVTHTISISI